MQLPTLPRLALWILTCVLVCDVNAADRPDLNGLVKGPDGKPVSGAHVWVYTAGVKKGTNPLCPSCYLDCSKKAVTDAAGTFTLPSLDPELKFTILVQSEGFKPMLVREVDPAKGAMETKLEAFDWKKLDQRRVLRGRVLDKAGAPVVGAELSPSFFDTTSVSRSAEGIFDPVAVTDSEGQFAITATDPIKFVVLKVKARGLAPATTEMLTPDRTDHEIRLGQGVAVVGRLLQDGEPVKNAAVGMVQMNRSAGGFFGNLEIATNDAGGFRFDNVHPDTDYAVYTLMDSLKEKGAATLKQVRAGGDESTLDVGTMEVAPAHRLSGRIVLEDGSPLPPGVRMMLSRGVAWDHQIAMVGSDGSFSFEGLPPEGYGLSVKVPDYRLSPKNASFWRSNDQLYGRVDRDVDGLIVLLEKGSHHERPANKVKGGRKPNLKKTELRGIPQAAP